jgi:hypothetical protein
MLTCHAVAYVNSCSSIYELSAIYALSAGTLPGHLYLNLGQAPYSHHGPDHVDCSKKHILVEKAYTPVKCPLDCYTIKDDTHICEDFSELRKYGRRKILLTKFS